MIYVSVFILIYTHFGVGNVHYSNMIQIGFKSHSYSLDVSIVGIYHKSVIRLRILFSPYYIAFQLLYSPLCTPCAPRYLDIARYAFDKV